MFARNARAPAEARPCATDGPSQELRNPLQCERAGFPTFSLPRHLDLIARDRPFKHHLGSAGFHAERNIVPGDLAVGKRLLTLGSGGRTRELVAAYFEHEC